MRRDDVIVPKRQFLGGSGEHCLHVGADDGRHRRVRGDADLNVEMERLQDEGAEEFDVGDIKLPARRHVLLCDILVGAKARHDEREVPDDERDARGGEPGFDLRGRIDVVVPRQRHGAELTFEGDCPLKGRWHGLLCVAAIPRCQKAVLRMLLRDLVTGGGRRRNRSLWVLHRLCGRGARPPSEWDCDATEVKSPTDVRSASRRFRSVTVKNAQVCVRAHSRGVH